MSWPDIAPGIYTSKPKTWFAILPVNLWTGGWRWLSFVRYRKAETYDFRESCSFTVYLDTNECVDASGASYKRAGALPA